MRRKGGGNIHTRSSVAGESWGHSTVVENVVGTRLQGLVSVSEQRANFKLCQAE